MKTNMQTRKLQLIQEVMRLKNEKIIKKHEEIFHQEKKKGMKEFSQMTIKEYNALLDQAEDDSLNNRLFNAGDILRDIDAWK